MENYCKEQFGSVQYKGEELTLTQHPYLGDDIYVAHATDNEENDYLVKWEIKESYKEISEDDTVDESDMCDWEEYTVVRA